jgi:hypothetical protein
MVSNTWVGHKYFNQNQQEHERLAYFFWSLGSLTGLLLSFLGDPFFLPFLTPHLESLSTFISLFSIFFNTLVASVLKTSDTDSPLSADVSKKENPFFLAKFSPSSLLTSLLFSKSILFPMRATSIF